MGLSALGDFFGKKDSVVKKVAELLLFGLAVTASPHYAVSGEGGGVQGGGGDPTEERIMAIRDDISKWIDDGGARNLKLPADVGYDYYVRQMKSILYAPAAPDLPAVIVGSINNAQEAIETDQDKIVKVGGQWKTCRSGRWREDGRLHIQCNVERFAMASPGEQYRLIHHEYAALVGIEKNVGPASDYDVSRGLESFVDQTVVFKLTHRKYRVPACGNLNLREKPEGTVCRTSKGSTFRLLRRTTNGYEVWHDMTSGLVWSDVVHSKNPRYGSAPEINYVRAMGLCENYSSFDARGNITDMQFHLPSPSQFASGTKSGFEEVLPSNRSGVFWTDKAKFEEDDEGPMAGSSSHAYRYELTPPSLVFVVIGTKMDYAQVRCVGVAQAL